MFGHVRLQGFGELLQSAVIPKRKPDSRGESSWPCAHSSEEKLSQVLPALTLPCLGLGDASPLTRMSPLANSGPSRVFSLRLARSYYNHNVNNMPAGERESRTNTLSLITQEAKHYLVQISLKPFLTTSTRMCAWRVPVLLGYISKSGYYRRNGKDRASLILTKRFETS